MLFKFAANKKIVLPRHMVHNNTFVVQGEQRLYEPDGTLKRVRPTGMYSPPRRAFVPREGGGLGQNVVMFSILADMTACSTKSWTTIRMSSPRSATPTCSARIKRTRALHRQ